MVGVIGLNYKTTPLSFREKFSFFPHEIGEFLPDLKDDAKIREGVLLSTCNRLEIYFYTEQDCMPSCFHKIVPALFLYKNINQDLTSCFYAYQDKEAILHLLSVAAGLDSMVLGENQILGQVKEAYRIAVANACSGPVLNKLFHKAFNAGKRVRTETGINRGASSVGYAAVELIAGLDQPLSSSAVFLIGMGQTGCLVLQSLFNRGCGSIHMTNRTFEKMLGISREYKANPVPFAETDKYLGLCDIIITSTSASEILITSDRVRRAVTGRTKPLCLIDLSVPRDVDEEVRTIPGVSLYNIDNLESVVAHNHLTRQKEIAGAREIIRDMSSEYLSWMESLHLSPVIQSLKTRIGGLADTELDNIKSSIPEAEFSRLNQVVQVINNKYLGLIVKNLKNLMHSEKELAYIEMLNNLFELKDLK